MSKKFKLSIIIPIYGVEKFIQKFLDSLLPQLNTEVELIFIDDGCKDSSIEILSTALQQLPLDIKKNIKVIQQVNQGLSAARNAGLRVTQGLYVTFLDSDDSVMENYIASILAAISTQKFDILHFNIKQLNKDNIETQIDHVHKTQLTTITNRYLNDLFLLNHWYAFMRVFHHNLLTDFSFPVGLVFEDILSFPFLYKIDLAVYELNEALVIYQYRSDSITNKGVSKNVLNSFTTGINIYRETRDEPHLRHVYFYIILMLFNYKLELGRTAYFEFIESIEDSDLVFFRQHLEGTHWKKKLMIKYPRVFFYYKNRFNKMPRITLKD